MITIDEDRGTVTANGRTHRLDTPEAFALVSDAWLRAGWWVKHPYTLTWLGRPVIQLPEDLMRMQELVFRVQPDVIVETGVAHGGSLIFHATLCKALGRGRVVGVDIEIRPANRAAIQEHALFPLITLIEGDSTDAAIVARVRQCIGDGDRVLVFLDSNHSREHVLRELRAYSPLVTPGSYIVAMDGYIMELVAGGPRTAADWSTNNAKAAAAEFARDHSSFVLEEPPFLFNESLIQEPVSYCRGGVLRRKE